MNFETSIQVPTESPPPAQQPESQTIIQDGHIIETACNKQANTVCTSHRSVPKLA